MASRERMLAGIQPGMRLTKGFIKSIYFNEISWPGFADQAIAALEKAGCSKARQYYDGWVNKYEAAYEAEMKEVAHWYRLECEKQWGKRRKEGGQQRKQEEKKRLQQMNNRDLIALLENLTGAI